MHALMTSKTNLSNECFITYFTAIWVLTTMYACVLYQTTLIPECLITHIKKHNGIHQYVCVDVFLDWSVD